MNVFVETSAIVAILLEEDDADVILQKLLAAEVRVTSVIALAEAGFALGKNLGDFRFAERILQRFTSQMRIDVLPASPDLLTDVLDAAARYGKGVGRPLNFGDLFSYALAKRLDYALLCKGNDFPKTDLILA